MNREETAALLRSIRALDPFYRGFSAEEAAQVLTDWQQILRGVPAVVAAQAVERHYSQPKARSLTPGDIRDTWRQVVERREQERDREEREQARILAESTLGQFAGLRPEWFDAYLALFPTPDEWRSAHASHPKVRRDKIRELTARRDAVPQIRDWLNAHPEHLMGTPTVGERPRERDCGQKDCACSHTECREGWADEPVLFTRHGIEYEAVKRCAMCEDALKMSGERV